MIDWLKQQPVPPMKLLSKDKHHRSPYLYLYVSSPVSATCCDVEEFCARHGFYVGAKTKAGLVETMDIIVVSYPRYSTEWCEYRGIPTKWQIRCTLNATPTEDK